MTPASAPHDGERRVRSPFFAQRSAQIVGTSAAARSETTGGAIRMDSRHSGIPAASVLGQPFWVLAPEDERPLILHAFATLASHAPGNDAATTFACRQSCRNETQDSPRSLFSMTYLVFIAVSFISGWFIRA